jgi:divalent metal cation (Fe/Co/Zn/Cd) transporter
VSHGHSHGLVDPSIVRSRAGVRAVAASLFVLGLATGAQIAVFALTDSVALLADLVHNGGDALTAVPLGIAFLLRPSAAEREQAMSSWRGSASELGGGSTAQHSSPMATTPRTDAFVSLGVIASAAAIAAGLPIADPLIGLGIALVIVRVSFVSWRVVSHAHAH